MIARVPRTLLAPAYDISRVLKGGWQLAGGHGAIDPAAAMADMDGFVAAGITTFDCADIYTGVEALIGTWLKRHRGRGDAPAVQVHTKYVPDIDRLPFHSRTDVTRGIDRSLGRLAVERLDLVQLHWWDFDVPGYIDAAAWLDELRRAGKVRHVGLTNFDRRRLGEILAANIPVLSHQVQYSVLDRRPAGEMATLCSGHRVALLCYGALAGGFLSERYLGVADPPPPLENRSLVKYRLIIDEFGGWERFQTMLRTLQRVSARHHVSIGAVALRWILDRPGVAGVIVGARHARHLEAITDAFRITLDAADQSAIASVHADSAGPSGDVYALEREKGGRHASVMRYTLNREERARRRPDQSEGPDPR
jgi:aryl-alcohol dehydrogenase-like predicted oxidoreductase